MTYQFIRGPPHSTSGETYELPYHFGKVCNKNTAGNPWDGKEIVLRLGATRLNGLWGGKGGIMLQKGI